MLMIAFVDEPTPAADSARKRSASVKLVPKLAAVIAASFRKLRREVPSQKRLEVPDMILSIAGALYDGRREASGLRMFTATRICLLSEKGYSDQQLLMLSWER